MESTEDHSMIVGEKRRIRERRNCEVEEKSRSDMTFGKMTKVLKVKRTKRN